MVLLKGIPCLFQALITYAEAFAFLHLSSQASIYTSKRYMGPLIKVFEHIKLVSGITASELKQNKPGVQRHCKWKYFSCSKSASGWQLCFVKQKSCISWNDGVFPSLLPALPSLVAPPRLGPWVHVQPTGRQRGQNTAQLPKVCNSVLIHWKGMFCRPAFFVGNSAGCLIFL